MACEIAAWTGLDKGELEGLRWEDFRNGDLYVTRKVWERHGERTENESAKSTCADPACINEVA
jgi:hypothetical protein